MTTRRACNSSSSPACPRSSPDPTGASTTRATDRQVWIAAGVGVAPFLSWLRALDEHPPHHVDFFYTAAGEAPFAEEIRQIADRHPSLHAHLIDTRVDGRLTPEHVLACRPVSGQLLKHGHSLGCGRDTRPGVQPSLRVGRCVWLRS